MNKVISVAAILALTAADNSFLRIKNLFPTHQYIASKPGTGPQHQIGHFGPITDSAHDDEQIMLHLETVPISPQRPISSSLGKNAHDDEQIMLHLETVPISPKRPVSSSLGKNAHDDEQQIIRLDPREWNGFFNTDDEFFNIEKAEGKIHEGAKKTQKDVKNLAGILKKLSHEQRNGAQGSNDLSALGQLIKEGHTLHNEGKTQRNQKKSEVHDHNLNFKDLKDKVKDKIKGAVNWVGDHPQVISEGAKAVKTLRGRK